MLHYNIWRMNVNECDLKHFTNHISIAIHGGKHHWAKHCQLYWLISAIEKKISYLHKTRRLVLWVSLMFLFNGTFLNFSLGSCSVTMIFTLLSCYSFPLEQVTNRSHEQLKQLNVTCLSLLSCVLYASDINQCVHSQHRPVVFRILFCAVNYRVDFG